MNWLLPLSIAQTAAVAFLGFCVLDLTAKTNRLAEASASPSVATSPVQPILASAQALSADDIRAVIREEMATIKAAPLGVGDPAALAAAAPRAAVNPAHESKVREQLRTYMSRGRMTTAEVDQFQDMVAELPAEERRRMLREFSAALNSGKIDAKF